MSSKRGSVPNLATGETTPQSDSDDGADVTLIRWMLSLTPAERLATLERTVNGILELRERNAES